MVIALLAMLGIGAFFIFDEFNNDDDHAEETPENVDTPGTNGADFIGGTPEDDLLLALGGNDLVVGEQGQDTIDGGNGLDLLMGGKGDDLIEGRNDDDLLIGGKGEDTLNGGKGDDVLFGSDAVRDVELGRDLLAAETEQDFNAILDSDDYYDDSRDLAQADILNGGDGEDVLIMGSNDTGTSGEGEDLIVIGDWIDPDKGPAVITDLRDPDTSGDLLVYNYNGANAAPVITVEHDEVAGVSHVYADNGLVLEVLHVASAPLIKVGDISLVAYSV
ncbi:MAG: calcium-binding protein [Pseudooceanicola sp.]